MSAAITVKEPPCPECGQPYKSAEAARADLEPYAGTWIALTQLASLWLIGFDNFELIPATTRPGQVGITHGRIPHRWTSGRKI